LQLNASQAAFLKTKLNPPGAIAAIFVLLGVRAASAEARFKRTGTDMEHLYLSGRFTNAVNYARHLHIEQRKGTRIPYMAHLLGVAALVMGETGHVPFAVTEDMIIAALLHDAAEDHGGKTRLEDIEHNFGADVARIVEGLSDTLSEDSSKKEPWEERKKKYLERLRAEPAEVKLISAADKLYNARSILDDYREIKEEVWSRFKRGRDQQLGYFDALLEIFKTAGTNRIVEELERVVDELKQISAHEKR
jgi:(p)ppGpp synthase/HD superfamily hydrolase